MSAGNGAKATPFRCNGCGEPLQLRAADDGLRCLACSWLAGDKDGVLDFVRDPAKLSEADFYDAEYRRADAVAPASVLSLRQLWIDNPYAPYNELLWQRMQGLKDKLVVVLGSGAAPRELDFLNLEPAALVISDLSKPALRSLRDAYLPDPPANLTLAAIDAEDLPFAPRSVEVVYGYLFVHHLPHRDAFLAEVARVLAPGGRAVFLDAAYAPLWERSKQTWLHGVMRLTHRVNPPSPEDLRFTLDGAFRIDDLERQIRALGGVPWFERSTALQYLAVRASEIASRINPALSLGHRAWIAQPEREPPYRLVWRHRRFLDALNRTDAWLSARSQIAARNRVRLAWGFTMPCGSSGDSDRS